MSYRWPNVAKDHEQESVIVAAPQNNFNYSVFVKTFPDHDDISTCMVSVAHRTADEYWSRMSFAFDHPYENFEGAAK